jgi:RNA polymerase sigma factor (sigma-70 family)
MAKQVARREWQGLELVDVEVEEGRAGDSGDADGRSAESFESFYLREFPRLVTLARALAGDPHAQDIAQDAMIVAYRAWHDVSRYPSPGAWVRGVCANKAISSLRRRAAESRALSRLRLSRPLAAAAAPAEDEMFWREVRQLPQRQAQSVALFYALDLSVAEIAVTLDCSDGTVKTHLSRARSSLAKRLGMEKGVES